MSQETKREITIAAILATLICLMAFAICRLSLTFVQDTFLAGTAATLEQGGKKAEPLIRALDEYMKKVGTYPERLDQLVPLYLSVVPKPAPQYEFIYQRSDDGRRFSLNFVKAYDAENYCGYSSSERLWHCVDSEKVRP